MNKTLKDKRVLLIICGGIAAYKSLDLVRRLRDRGADVRCILTSSAQKFVTPLSVESLSSNPVATDLWTGDSIAHIDLARNSDIVVVSPTTANFISKMSNGVADDLASAVTLAAKVPILIAPAMNPSMWHHPATIRNLVRLREDGIYSVGPIEGEMAESHESGMGRLADVIDIVESVESLCGTNRILSGRTALVTAGPTREPIDPVRYISNHSSGKQGYAIADQLSKSGADVTLVHGTTTIESPQGVNSIGVESASQMQDAVESNLPSDIAIFVAAVADWRVKELSDQKLSKTGDEQNLSLISNPDILASIANRTIDRPKLVVGFAAQTIDNAGLPKMLDRAQQKRQDKGADWILANDVSTGTETFGGDHTTVHFITGDSNESWGRLTKREVARKLVSKIPDALSA